MLVSVPLHTPEQQAVSAAPSPVLRVSLPFSKTQGGRISSRSLA